jgi:hypothetical protein
VERGIVSWRSTLQKIARRLIKEHNLSVLDLNGLHVFRREKGGVLRCRKTLKLTLTMHNGIFLAV